MSLRLRPAAKPAEDQAETPGAKSVATKPASKSSTKPATGGPARRGSRTAGHREDRRNLYVNLAFAGTVVVGVLLLAAAVGANYYEDHFGKVALVNGQTITKDDLRDRVAVDAWRLNHAESNVRNALSSGRMTQDQANAQLQQLQSSRQAMPKSSLDALVDAALTEQLATQQGISISDKQVDDALTAEATSIELRHSWVIEVAPVLGQSELTPTDAEKAAAKSKADQALAAIKAGQKWEDVAIQYSSTDGTTTLGKGGDLGWLSKDGTSPDKAFVDAVFALPLNGVSDVVEGADGTYRIGRVTEIDAPKTDPNYIQSIKDGGVSLDAYRAAVKGEVARKALDDKITASVVDTATVQRLVSEIHLQGTPGGTPADEVKTAHILFSPNGDAQSAPSLSASDPAWARAEASANTTYEILKKDPSKFAELAKTESNDTASGTDGGTLPWFRQSDVDPAFGKAVFATGLTAGEILPPVKSRFGWHVIRFDARRADPSIRINQLHDQLVAGGDFAAIAKANSDAADASKGGDMGWVARNQIAKDLEDAIFAAPVGTVSGVYKGTDGWYIFLVRQEATRTPSGDQLTTLKNTAFSNWYAQQKKAAAIIEDQVAAQ
ncbi:MAG TPA: peptidylprolyl isomerase [Candidatus Limnocylindrales bacterium]